MESIDKAVKTDKPQSLQEWMNWEAADVDFQYEWVAGKLVKTSESMKPEELLIISNIMRAFTKTEAYQQRGELVMETKTLLRPDQGRIPDVSFYTNPQIKEAYQDKSFPLPAFVIEVVSPGEHSTHTEQKALEYLKAGVQVIWHIYPELQLVRVRTSLREEAIAVEEDLISAAPAVPDLKMKVSDVFRVE
jgi:Uma2 family endonuclease